MEAKEKFLEYLKFLPDLRNKYFPGDFFFNFYGGSNPIRIGCRYSDASLGEEEKENYLVIIEVFKEKPKVEFFDSEKINNEEVIYGYISEFPLMKKYLDECYNFASVIRGNRITTIINLKKPEENGFPDLYSFFDAKKDENLKNFLVKFLSEKRQIKVLPIFDFVDYLPTRANEWKLVTFFCSYLSQEVEGRDHLISNIQGNYEKGGKYLNLILRFLYKMSEGKVNIEPEGMEENIGEIKIKKNKVGNILNLSYYNQRENFVVIVSNNETTPEFENYEGELRNLLLSAIDKLKNYNCVEQTMKFIEESKKLMKT